MNSFASGFDSQPILKGGGLRLRPLRAADKPGLAAAAADPLIWADHPAQDRWQPQVFGPYFDWLLAQGGALAVFHQPSGQIIGTSRFYFAGDEPQSLSIGYTFLTRAHWGGATNYRMKALMLAHAFKWSDRIWLHIDPGNARSQIAAARLGALHSHDAPLDLGRGAALRQWWQITRPAWQAVQAARP